ncbi:sensor histidine kinase [Nocardia callitridis]|uniref:histidine kinase n=1 Tax=Nocardia callitridis TaxID=648753 RepID=A0ABP9JTV0_9NOCA
MSGSRLASARATLWGLPSAIPLRVTLMVVLVATAAAGLLISGIAVTSAMEASLTNRTDQQLHDVAVEWARRVEMPPPPPPIQQQEQSHPPGRYFVRAESDRPAGNHSVYYDNVFGVDTTPQLPDAPGKGPETVGSVNDSSTEWRVLTLRTPTSTTTVGLPLTENREVVRKLIVLQLSVGAIVLTALAIVAYFVIRRSLQPLRRVENTAAAIARGDLYRRVPVHGTNTEVDRLSRSLNGMLAQIQRAFAATEESEAAARQSETRMRRFVADASHELRTPLTTIKGFAELYRQGAHGEADRFMDRIERESRRMGLLVEDLLMLARLDAQRPLERKPVDLLTLASDAVHNARTVSSAAHPDGPQRPIDLEIRSGEGTLEVVGDEARLRQILANLVNNAIIHTPLDASVTVRLTPRADEVLLEVADTGLGLPAEQAERVFERFYRADDSRSRDSGGTGLGLSIVQALVAAHGGTISVSTAPGEGTVFEVLLPRERAAE